MSGIIRTGAGDLALRDVPGVTPHHLIGRNGEAFARAYEAQHPDVVVVSDWELISDVDIAAMSPERQAIARQDRANLAARRAAAAARPAATEPARSGDPERTKELLRRARIDLDNLDVMHSDYERLFLDFTSQIRGYELALIADGELAGPPTEFKIATRTKAKTKVPTEVERLTLESKVKDYKALGFAARKAAIGAATDPALTRALLEVEQEQPIREMIVKKLFTMGATA